MLCNHCPYERRLGARNSTGRFPFTSHHSSEREYRTHMSDQQTIQSAIQELAKDLRAYLEAQYHVRDESVLLERKLLLSNGATIAQRPYLEATPAYSLSDEYSKLDLPAATKELLSRLSKISGSEIYPKPYGHQALALTAFLKDGRDVLAATGTGSGKTEIFLLSILGSLAEECRLEKI